MRPRSIAAVTFVALAWFANVAAAQSSNSEASDHHRAGVAYSKASKWPEALREFEEAYKLDPSPLRIYDIAQVLSLSKQYVRARDAYAKIVDSPALSADQQQRARAGIAAAKANIARVRVAVSDARPSDVVTVDGAKPHGDVVEVDPGKHVVRLARESESNEVVVDVAPGAEATARIAIVPAAPPASPPSSSGASSTRDEPEPSSGTPVVAWIFTGVAVAAIGTGVALEVVGRNEYNEVLDSGCDPQCGGRDRPGRQKALAGDILIGAGVVSAGLAAYFFVTSVGKPSPSKRSTRWQTPPIDVAFGADSGLIRLHAGF